MNSRPVKYICFLIGLGCVFPGQWALAEDGWYMGMELGVPVAPEMDTRHRDNDYPSVCDTFINPGGFIPAGSTAACTQPSGGEDWSGKFDGDAGLMAGGAAGYRWNDFRLEAEYLNRTVAYDSSNSPRFGEIDLKDVQELSKSEQVIGDVSAHHFFANAYYDYHSDSRWTPYVGFGFGAAKVSVDYFARFPRSINPAHISTFNAGGTAAGQCDQTCAALNRELAGTTTIGRRTLSDTMFGYQAIAGVDYRVSDPVSIGLKFRYADFGEFEDGGEWDQLRSHDATNYDTGNPSLTDPDDPRRARVRYQFATDDITFWGVSITMKYRF